MASKVAQQSSIHSVKYPQSDLYNKCLCQDQNSQVQGPNPRVLPQLKGFDNNGLTHIRFVCTFTDHPGLWHSRVYSAPLFIRLWPIPQPLYPDDLWGFQESH